MTAGTLYTAQMKKLLAIIGLCAAAGSSSAQQLPHYSQYMLNDYVMNPAIAGKNPYFEGKSDNRYQWIGITDAPRTYVLSVNGPHKNGKVGMGGYLFTDIVGPTRRTGISMSYAYHMKLNDNGTKLSLGLSAGLLQFAVDGSKITLRDQADLVISNGYQSVIVPDLGFGAYFYSDKYYIGASVPQIYRAKLRFFDYTTSDLSRLETHFYFSGGYRFDIGDDFAIEPSTLVKIVKPVPVQFDLGTRFIYKKKMWIGGAYRNLDAVSAMVGYLYDEYLTFGYSYDFTTTNIKNYSTGTHEVLIGVRFKKQSTSGSAPKI
jgi:type IX secretion system PorP/SprF family membrane protein